MDDEFADFFILCKSEVDTHLVLLSPVDTAAVFTQLCFAIGCCCQNPCADAVAIGDGAFQIDLQPIVPGADVAEELIWAFVKWPGSPAVGDEQIEVSVSIIVCHRHALSFAVWASFCAACSQHLNESAVALVFV